MTDTEIEEHAAAVAAMARQAERDGNPVGFIRTMAWVTDRLGEGSLGTPNFRRVHKRVEEILAARH